MTPTHWIEYGIEAALLGTFMLVACAAVSLFEHPGSIVRQRFRTSWHRRSLVGILMGLTAIALIYSPPGQRSGAHMNPGVTLAFWLLGKIVLRDAISYVVAQFLGGLTGVMLARALLQRTVAHPDVRFAVTVPGRYGALIAWLAEFTISFGMMGMVLVLSNRPEMAPYTGLLAGVLVAAYIAIEAPLSGMSLNPARTLASAIAAREFRGLWVYFTAPPLAMVAAAAVYAGVAGRASVVCAKLAHPKSGECIFGCSMASGPARAGEHRSSPQPRGGDGIQPAATE